MQDFKRVLTIYYKQYGHQKISFESIEKEIDALSEKIQWDVDNYSNITFCGDKIVDTFHAEIKKMQPMFVIPPVYPTEGDNKYYDTMDVYQYYPENKQPQINSLIKSIQPLSLKDRINVLNDFQEKLPTILTDAIAELAKEYNKL